MTKKRKLGPYQTAYVEALESGKYRRGKDYLKQRKGTHTLYCALGVAQLLFNGKFEENDEYLTNNVRKKLGLRDCGGHANNNSMTSIIGMNDRLNMSFVEIARWLRRYPSAYFSKAQ